jgi:hypothetical protein
MGREEARLLEEIGRCAVGSMVYEQWRYHYSEDSLTFIYFFND